MSGLQDLVGQSSQPYRFVVEEGKIAEFVRAVGATHPLFRDREAAVAAGLRGILAPPTFVAASAHWAPRDGGLSLGLDVKRVLAGGGEWQYFQPVCAGDELTVTMHVESVKEKQGSRGPMEIMRVRTDFERDGELVQVYANDIIQFAPVGGEKSA